MTKQQALQDFKENVMPVIRDAYEQDGRIDHPARSEAWNNYVDMLHSDGEITEKQADNWDNPF